MLHTYEFSRQPTYAFIGILFLVDSIVPHNIRKCCNNAAVAQIFLSLIEEAFIAHESWRKTKDKLTYDSWAEDFKIRLNKALATWLNQVGYASGLLLKSLRDKAKQWWYFLDDPSVPPDNNLAERSLRLAVTRACWISAERLHGLVMRSSDQEKCAR